MNDALYRLKSALADRYIIQRELGAGGVYTVYLAEDLKHHRKVAVRDRLSREKQLPAKDALQIARGMQY
jgi:hypothetical protein